MLKIMEYTVPDLLKNDTLKLREYIIMDIIQQYLVNNILEC